MTPNWFESGDRFWYAYATSKGQRWMMVDTVKKSKAPLFDAADLAAQLTNIVRIPFDSAHLAPCRRTKIHHRPEAHQEGHGPAV